MRITIDDVKQIEDLNQRKIIEFNGKHRGEDVLIQIPKEVMLKLGYILNPIYGNRN